MFKRKQGQPPTSQQIAKNTIRIVDNIIEVLNRTGFSGQHGCKVGAECYQFLEGIKAQAGQASKKPQ